MHEPVVSEAAQVRVGPASSSSFVGHWRRIGKLYVRLRPGYHTIMSIVVVYENEDFFLAESNHLCISL